MIHFVGAGCGAADLITVRGKALLEQADVIVYAGSLVNPALLEYKKEGCRVYDSARMTLEEVLAVMQEAEAAGLDTVRLHTGDPCLYGAIREQMDQLDHRGIPYDYCPGVSAFSGAAAALKMEYTLPDVSQSVIITRMAGRTPVPARESVRSFAAHGATMVLFLSAGLLRETQNELLAGGYEPDTPAAIVYKASWPDESVDRRGGRGEAKRLRPLQALRPHLLHGISTCQGVTYDHLAPFLHRPRPGPGRPGGGYYEE